MRLDCSASDVLTLLIAIGWCLCHMMPGWAASFKRATASLAQSVGAAIAISDEALIKQIRTCAVLIAATPRVPAAAAIHWPPAPKPQIPLLWQCKRIQATPLLLMSLFAPGTLDRC